VREGGAGGACTGPLVSEGVVGVVDPHAPRKSGMARSGRSRGTYMSRAPVGKMGGDAEAFPRSSVHIWSANTYGA